MLVQKPDGGTEEKAVHDNLKDRQVLPDDEIMQLAKYGLTIEDHYGRTMDVEWGLDRQTDKLLILQARPETVWSLKKSRVEQKALKTGRRILVKGLPASPGVGAGKTHLIPAVEAVSEFHKILNHRSLIFADPVGAAARLQLARAYAMSGDQTKAKSAYEDFLTLWRDADPEIPVLKQAKAEYAKLR
jgi:hypothetical protein